MPFRATLADSSPDLITLTTKPIEESDQKAFRVNRSLQLRPELADSPKVISALYFSD